MFLSGFKNISFGVQEHIFWGSSKYRLGYKHTSFGVQGSIFLNVVTRLSRRAEPSRQVCWLQSARLLSLVASPFKRTTIPWFFPSFPFRASYLHSHPAEGYANLAILTSFLSHNQSIFKGLIIYFFVTLPIGSLSLNDDAKIRLFSGTTKFQDVIRGDFQQLSIWNCVNNPNS